MVSRKLSGYEVTEDYELCWVRQEDAIAANMRNAHGEMDREEYVSLLFELEPLLMKKLQEEGLV